ncbi:hypothetical protein MWU75_08895, partial [Ornithinimicrobium sp. F0845]|nr:hypothetical protein [Ornithinimicrobium sp. F0845]
HRFQCWDLIRLTRRNLKTGRLVNGPNPDTAAAERARHTHATHPEQATYQATSKTDGPTPGAADSPAPGAADSPAPGTTDSPADGAAPTDDTPDPADGVTSGPPAATPAKDTPEHGPWATPDDTPPPF